MATTSIPKDIPLLPEIWLQILTYLCQVDIASASLTCQSLHQIAQPLLVRTLTFEPYILGPDGRRRRLPNDDIVQRSLQRLAFCSSNQLIAPAVRRLTMWPIYDALFKDHGPEHDLILDKIFERLPKFVNLATIVCHGILCTNR